MKFVKKAIDLLKNKRSPYSTRIANNFKRLINTYEILENTIREEILVNMIVLNNTRRRNIVKEILDKYNRPILIGDYCVRLTQYTKVSISKTVKYPSISHPVRLSAKAHVSIPIIPKSLS